MFCEVLFIISAIIGVGFATGAEIAHFFNSGNSIVVAVIVFFVVFVGLSWFFLHIKYRHNISNLNQLNQLAFGKGYYIGNILLILLFIITSSAMLAGGDNLVRIYLGFKVPFTSLFLSTITFFIVLGGLGRIKYIANIIMPIIIIVIIINAGLNFNTKLALQGNGLIDIIYPIIFCCENFITLIAVLLTTKAKSKILSFTSGFIISIIILLAAFAIGDSSHSMPMLSISKNLGNMFFSIYILSVIFALFTTLEISTHSCLQIVSTAHKNRYFSLLILLLVCQIIAYLGFNFIVRYLYTAVGILGAIYLIVLIIRLMVINAKK